MPLFLKRACVAAAVLATPALASEAISKADVLAAIRTFEANTSANLTASKPDEQIDEALAAASATITRYALESDDVVVDLGAGAVPWCDLRRGVAGVTSSEGRALLLAAYLSGGVKAQLLSGKQDANPYPGWIAMLRVYRIAKMREGVAIPEIERLLAKQMDGSLEAYALDTEHRSIEALRRTYGDNRPVAQSKEDVKTLASQP
jgi:hypothetical protein